MKDKLKNRLLLKEDIIINFKKYFLFSFILMITGYGYLFNSGRIMKNKASVKISYLAGKVSSWKIPIFLREYLFRIYINFYNVNTDEILQKDLSKYSTVNEFFTRQIDLTQRPFDPNARIVSPCDGRVLSFTEIKDRTDMIIVKDMTYNVFDFLFGRRLKKIPSLIGFINEKDDDYKFYQLTIYLSPSDYHRYHSPCDMLVTDRVYLPGTLFPVKPSYVEKHKTTFIENERVTLKCKTRKDESPFFITFVGALNVGSININYDNFSNEGHYIKEDVHESYVKLIKDNGEDVLQKRKDENREFGKMTMFENLNIRKKTRDETLIDNDAIGNLMINKLDEIGCFKFGSTIVMVFPLKSNEKVSDVVKPGNYIKLGTTIV